MIILDDHLALLAIAGRLPGDSAHETLTTTYSFHYRLVRAVSDDASHGSLSRRLPNPAVALRRLVHPPADRLTVLDPRSSLEVAVAAARRHNANLILAELIGAAVFHGAKVRLTAGNVGLGWPAAMAAEGIDMTTVTV
ncbi:MAG: hypothetical protein ACRD0Z_08035 [Acidimicrobiales bacterium]